MIHSKRDILINKEIHTETKTNDDVILKKVNNEIQPDESNIIKGTNTITSKNNRDIITEDIKPNDNHNEQFTKMDGVMQPNVTPGPDFKYSQLGSEILGKKKTREWHSI